LPLDGTTEYELYVKVTDGNGGSDTATVTIKLRPLVTLTGDTHAVESTGDTITINIVRYANDLSEELSVEYEVNWYDATRDDLLNPEDLVDDADATKETRTVVFEAGESVISVTLAPKQDDDTGLEKFSVTLQESSSGSYALPKNTQDVKDKGKKVGLAGRKKLTLRILDGVTLFGPNNSDPDLEDKTPTGVHWNDINQGVVGDCYCLAAVASVALRHPQQIVDLFTDNGDGTVSITFHKENGETPVITVPMTLDYGMEQAELTNDTGVQGYYEVWPQVLESAYREFLKAHVPGEDFEGGYTHDVWNHLFDDSDHSRVHPSTKTDQEIADRIKDEWNDSGRVTLSTYGNVADKGPLGKDLVQNHVYVIVDYKDGGTNDPGDDIMELFNPWGLGDKDDLIAPFSIADLRLYMDAISIRGSF